MGEKVRAFKISSLDTEGVDTDHSGDFVLSCYGSMSHEDIIRQSNDTESPRLYFAVNFNLLPLFLLDDGFKFAFLQEKDYSLSLPSRMAEGSLRNEFNNTASISSIQLALTGAYDIIAKVGDRPFIPTFQGEDLEAFLYHYGVMGSVILEGGIVSPIVGNAKAGIAHLSDGGSITEKLHPNDDRLENVGLKMNTSKRVLDVLVPVCIDLRGQEGNVSFCDGGYQGTPDYSGLGAIANNLKRTGRDIVTVDSNGLVSVYHNGELVTDQELENITLGEYLKGEFIVPEDKIRISLYDAVQNGKAKPVSPIVEKVVGNGGSVIVSSGEYPLKPLESLGDLVRTE
jgi:hypothetical protein